VNRTLWLLRGRNWSVDSSTTPTNILNPRSSDSPLACSCCRASVPYLISDDPCVLSRTVGSIVIDRPICYVGTLGLKLSSKSCPLRRGAFPLDAHSRTCASEACENRGAVIVRLEPN
jgi:hypothetical protein